MGAAGVRAHFRKQQLLAGGGFGTTLCDELQKAQLDEHRVQRKVPFAAGVFQQLVWVVEVVAHGPDPLRGLVDVLQGELAEFIEPGTGEQPEQR
ncbi:hypothetical protein D9M68_881560 [compost metagenome]